MLWAGQSAPRCHSTPSLHCVPPRPPVPPPAWPRPAGSEPAAAGSGGGDLTPAALEAQQAWRRQALVVPPVGRDPSEKPQSPADLLLDWVGYGALYAVSALPVVIAGTVILVLFLNSLR